ncbi:2098_t:CDS:2 [Dentiscutata heterogama]|uniref:2098_t:CDS:1 n=1 Tax=Dentiscutata heterogama TaxID=1316150 RepID=A0ACA9KCJ6_9GLOM|nr:2098_t:CDS:2 [Dentiscutata heterogama]
MSGESHQENLNSHYNTQLQKAYNALKKLQSSFLVISGLGGTVSLLGGLLSVKNIFTWNEPDTVNNTNENNKESNVSEHPRDWISERRNTGNISNYEKHHRRQYYYIRHLVNNVKITSMFVSIWIIIFSCLMIYVFIYSIIITSASSASSTSSIPTSSANITSASSANDDNDDYRTLIKWLFICPSISILFALIYTCQITITIPSIVEDKKLHYLDKFPLMLLIPKIEETSWISRIFYIFKWVYFIISIPILGLILGRIYRTSYDKYDENSNEDGETVMNNVGNSNEDGGMVLNVGNSSEGEGIVINNVGNSNEDGGIVLDVGNSSEGEGIVINNVGNSNEDGGIDVNVGNSNEGEGIVINDRDRNENEGTVVNIGGIAINVGKKYWSIRRISLNHDETESVNFLINGISIENMATVRNS